MRFCEECESFMRRVTTAGNTIQFTCRCNRRIDGTDDDTLMEEEYHETARSDLKHYVFVENSPHDLAGLTVLKDCLNCGLDYLTLIRVGINETTTYTCTCGFNMTHEKYILESLKSQTVKK